MTTNWTIRKARPDDREALSRICLLTADAGADGTALYSDPAFPGLIWAEPYLVHDPDFAFVLDTGREVVGYIIAAHDTASFEADLHANWWPALQIRYSGYAPQTTHDAMILKLLADPPRTPARRLASYPAHLHIDLLPVAQGAGYGRKLMETLWQALRERNVTGVHLGVGAANTKALGFYQRLGYSTIERDGAIYLGKTL